MIHALKLKNPAITCITFQAVDIKAESPALNRQLASFLRSSISPIVGA